jgi:DNA-binding Lrp family transcriptional regulator
MKAYMGLACKTGAYDQVLKKLLIGLNMDQKNVFLLFGPVDILIQFPELKSLEDFVENWFNPVRMIGAEEDLIAKTLSLFVITEGPNLIEQPSAFMFLNIQPKNLENVRENLLNMPEVLSADSVFGPYDIICSVKTTDQIQLERAVGRIQKIPGVESSMTSIVSPIPVLPAW